MATIGFLEPKRRAGNGRTVLFGIALIVMGTLLEFVAAVTSTEISRIGEHRANLAQLRAVCDAKRAEANAAAGTTDEIDRAWIDYDLRLGQLELAISDAGANVPNARAALRRRLVDQFAPPGPDTVLMQATKQTAHDAGFAEKRDVFVSVYRGFHARMIDLAAALAEGSARGDVTPAELNALQNIITAENSLAVRWAAISITAKAISDQAARDADDAAARFDAERDANLIQESIAP